MTPEKFNNIFQDTMMELERLVDFKGGQYANERNRLHNFDRAADILGAICISDTGRHLRSVKACRGIWIKQFTSLMDTIDGRDSTWTQDRCDEVINDLLVYLILTKAIFYREYGWKPKSQQLPLKANEC